MDKFKNKYRISSARLQPWDYGWNGAYFITICTKNKVCYFGDVTDNTMLLSQTGWLVDKICTEIPNHFPYIHLDHYVVMPNHIHMVLSIDKVDDHDGRRDGRNAGKDAMNCVSTTDGKDPGKDAMNCVSTSGGITGNNNPLLHDNISRVIRWYKGRVSFEVRKINPVFSWQPRFHDHIIRDAESYNKIAEYIMNNPESWKQDKFYSKES